MSERSDQTAANRERADRATLRLWELAYQKGAPAIYKIRKLIAKGADIHAPMPPSFQKAGAKGSRRLDDYRLVHLAALRNHYHLMETLLKADVWIDQPDKFGTTPLMMAASEGYATMVALLLAHGASPLWKDHSEHPASPQSALSMAILHDHHETTITLLDAGAPLDFTLPEGGDPCPITLHLDALFRQIIMLRGDEWVDSGQHYKLLWQRAWAWVEAPDVAQLTPELVCAISNIGRLDAVCDGSLWQGHEKALMLLLSDLPPWLANHMATSPALEEYMVPASPKLHIETPADVTKLSLASALVRR